MGQAEPGILELAVTRLTAELEPAFKEHPEPGRPDRMAEGLEPAVRVHGELTAELERSVELIAPGLAALGEPQVLHQDQLRGGEAIMNLGHRDLLARPVDAGLLVGIGGAPG